MLFKTLTSNFAKFSGLIELFGKFHENGFASLLRSQTSDGLMLAQRRIQWANIKTSLVLRLRSPELEFRILCLDGSVISIISPSPSFVYIICAKKLPQTPFISFPLVQRLDRNIRVD